MTVVVLSPHLDDAALSLGATIVALTRRGVAVRVVTVFAGDPSYTGSPSRWDSRRHPGDARAVFLSRREEDRAACATLGAEPVWLNHLDDLYEARRDPVEIWAELREHLADASVVLVPGYPLSHPDHRFLADLVREHLTELPCVMEYCELPYAILPRHFIGRLRVRHWARPRVQHRDRALQRFACEYFRHETEQFGLSAKLALRIGSPVSCESLAILHGEVPAELQQVLP